MRRVTDRTDRRAPGVLANALADARRPLGVQPRELPLTPPRVWQWIRESGR